jgi:hypothetical protein
MCYTTAIGTVHIGTVQMETQMNVAVSRYLGRNV